MENDDPDARTVPDLVITVIGNSSSSHTPFLIEMMKDNNEAKHPVDKEPLNPGSGSAEDFPDDDDDNNIKDLKEFYEDIAINSSVVRRDKPQPASSSPEDAQKWRQEILNDPKTKFRVIFQSWPRNPNGKAIEWNTSRPGKMTSNGIPLWGATLMDFFRINRFPGVFGLSSRSSRSRIERWMEDNGEAGYAKGVARFQEEPDPQLIRVYEIAILIKSMEVMAKNSNGGEVSELDESWPPASPFSPKAYPNPWPFKPFEENMIRYPTLQDYLPQCQLPKKLVVHDPWKILSARRHFDMDKYNKDKNKGKQKDVTHIYKLQLSTVNTERKEQEEKVRDRFLEDQRKARDAFLANPHSGNASVSGRFVFYPELGPAKPPIFIVFPLEEPRAQPEEAHLYLSPEGKLGDGNHSLVHTAEWELPRSLLYDNLLCGDCIHEDMRSILQEQDGPNNETRDPKWDELSGKYYLVEDKNRDHVVYMKNKWTGKEEDKAYFFNRGSKSTELVYEGPFRAIESRVKYPDLARAPYCSHINEKHGTNHPHPLTTKVHVAAKMSIKGDTHLENEAKNYQAFPKHFFEHWTGYNIVYPLHDPTPVGAIVPQFYGYYVPDDEEGANTSPGYRSPILLLESCGEQIDPDKLSADDRNECAALLYRFNEAGWVHNSVARRNILRQPGPLSTFPLDRMANTRERGGLGEKWSYRLIDFGRSFSTSHLEPLQANQSVMNDSSRMTMWVHGLEDQL